MLFIGGNNEWISAWTKLPPLDHLVGGRLTGKTENK
jgi:hypothetical protein